jgi:hypothetical protein
LDQYGKPVPGLVLGIEPFFNGDTRRWGKEPVKLFECITNEKGEYSIDTGDVKLIALAFHGLWNTTLDGEIYLSADESGSDFFVLNKEGKWMRDARTVSPRPLEYDESKPYNLVYGHCGPPERMIEFDRKLTWKENLPDDVWVCLNALNGEFKEGQCKDCDLQLHITRVSQVGQMLHYDFIAGKGAGVQLKRDPFGFEATPDGYLDHVSTEPIKVNGEWKTEWKVNLSAAPHPFSPEVYFASHEGQVYGVAQFRIGLERPKEIGHKPADVLLIEVRCIANPRGQRNLHYGARMHDTPLSPIPLPVTLPFKEDVPFVDARKIWAYADPNNENTLIVEGEKGAVEAGAGFSVLNRGLRGTQYNRVASDGSFKVTLAGKEGDPLSIEIGWPDGISPKTGKHVAEDEGVELAPRWRLAGEGKR